MSRTSRLVCAAVLLAVTLGAPQVAHAEDDDVLAGSPVVRRNLMFRAARHELAGLFGMTLGDPYVRNILPGVRYDYHLFDWLSFGGRLQVGIPVTTDTYDEIDEKVTRNNDTFAMEASSMRFLAMGHVSVSPLVGKMLAWSKLPIQFDVHIDLMAGLGGVGSTGDAIETGGGLSLGAAGGLRIFISRVLAVTVDLAAISANRALSVNRDSQETGKKTRFSPMLNLGVSFFMPPKLQRAE